MKKTFSVVACLFVLLMLPGVSLSATSATPRPYLSSHLGVTLMPDGDMTDSSLAATGTIEYKPGGAIDFAAGCNFAMFRMEGEIGYQRNEMDKAKVCSGGSCVYGSLNDSNIYALSFLGNVYLDFVNSSPFTPYIGGGLGVAYAKAEISEKNGFKNSYNDTVFAYQVGAGIAFAINPHMAIDLKYRYFATTDLDLGTTKTTFASHNIYGGFRYTF